jgi:hypothetical protein
MEFSNLVQNNLLQNFLTSYFKEQTLEGKNLGKITYNFIK